MINDYFACSNLTNSFLLYICRNAKVWSRITDDWWALAEMEAMYWAVAVTIPSKRLSCKRKWTLCNGNWNRFVNLWYFIGPSSSFFFYKYRCESCNMSSILQQIDCFDVPIVVLLNRVEEIIRRRHIIDKISVIVTTEIQYKIKKAHMYIFEIG